MVVPRDCYCNTHVDLVLRRQPWSTGPLKTVVCFAVLGRPSLCPFVQCLFWLRRPHSNNHEFTTLSFSVIPWLYFYVSLRAEQSSLRVLTVLL